MVRMIKIKDVQEYCKRNEDVLGNTNYVEWT